MVAIMRNVALLSAACLTAYGHIVSLHPSNGTDVASTSSNGAGHDTFLHTSFDTHMAAKSHSNLDMLVPDRHGKERGLYHIAHYMAQRGRDRILWLFPDFAHQCADDTDCKMALIGIPDSITQNAVNHRPSQRGEHFDSSDFWEHASEKGIKAEFDSALRTLILMQGISPSGAGGLDNLWNTVKKHKDLLMYLRALWRQTPAGHHHVEHGDVRKALKKVNKDRPMNRAPKAQGPSDYNPAGTLFLRSLLSRGICHGDAYICDRSGEDLSQSALIKLLRIGTMDHVLSNKNYLRTALREISDLPPHKGKKWQWPYTHYEHGKSHNKDVREAIENAVMETRRAANSLFMVVPQLRHTMEVFDTTTGQLTPATVMLFPNSDEPSSPLRDLGYLRYFTPDVKTNGTDMLFYSRFLHDVTPILSGSWMLIPVDGVGPKPARFEIKSKPSNESIAAAWRNAGIPDQLDMRVIQALRNDKGDIAVDSMGLPKLRSIS